ncbi:MAG: copper-translocating P-type ATPase [Clostridiaceae bacterium]
MKNISNITNEIKKEQGIQENENLNPENVSQEKLEELGGSVMEANIGDHEMHKKVHQEHQKKSEPIAVNEEHAELKHPNEHEGHEDHSNMVGDFKKRFIVSLILMVPILLLAPMIQMFAGFELKFPGDRYIIFILSSVLFFYGGKPFIYGAVKELKKKSPAMMTLIALAICVAYIYSSISLMLFQGPEYFWELATLIVIMLLGHWIEMRSIMGASRALEELVKLMPEEAHLIQENGEIVDIETLNLKTGDKILVKPGEKIPIDGLVYDGKSSVNESMITGESVPVTKGQGDEVIGGSINGEGIVRFQVSKTGEDTFLSQVIKLVKEAQESRSNTQRLADVAAKWLFYIAVGAGMATFIAWTSITGNIGFAIERAVTVVIIACPHALGLAVPLVTAVSTSIAAQKGLLIRNRVNFENARKIDIVVFDKTGTLTKGEFGVTDIQEIAVSKEQLLEIAYSLESQSEHPISLGIVREAERLNLKLTEPKNFMNITGQGLQGEIDGKMIKVVSPGYLKREKIIFDEEAYEKLANQGKTVTFVLENDKLLGLIALGDSVRDTAKEAIRALKEMKIDSYMITGDNKRAAAYIAALLEIDKVYAEVLPNEKALKIDEIHLNKKIVAMTGDGVNDAPALAKSDLGIAIGAGTDVAIETADIILVKSNPLDVVNILKLSRATYRKMVQNLIWATAYNIVALPLAAGILYYQGIVISPAMGAVLMSLSTIIVSINARLLKID